MSVNKVYMYTPGSTTTIFILTEVKMLYVSLLLFPQMSPLSNPPLAAVVSLTSNGPCTSDPLIIFSNLDGYEYVLSHGALCYDLLPSNHLQVPYNKNCVPRNNKRTNGVL
jgi:hypothetical protein